MWRRKSTLLRLLVLANLRESMFNVAFILWSLLPDETGVASFVAVIVGLKECPIPSPPPNTVHGG